MAHYQDDELNQEERERIIELMLGQDKVIALLYDRTAPATIQPNGVDIRNMGYTEQQEYI